MYMPAGKADFDFGTAEAWLRVVDEILFEIDRRYPDGVVTGEVGGFILGFQAARGLPDLSDLILAKMVARESTSH